MPRIGEWARVDALFPDDRLSAVRGDAKLLAVSYLPHRVPVYNLSIPGSPTYFVGEHGVWVHNCIPTGVPVPFSDAQRATRGLAGELQAHHLIERRHFARGSFEGNPNDVPGVVLTRPEHQEVTNLLRRELPYGRTHSPAAIRDVY